MLLSPEGAAYRSPSCRRAWAGPCGGDYRTLIENCPAAPKGRSISAQATGLGPECASSNPEPCKDEIRSPEGAAQQSPGHRPGSPDRRFGLKAL